MIFDWMGLGEEVVWVLNMLEMPRLRPDALKGGESGYLASGGGGSSFYIAVFRRRPPPSAKRGHLPRKPGGGEKRVPLCRENEPSDTA